MAIIENSITAINVINYLNDKELVSYMTVNRNCHRLVEIDTNWRLRVGSLIREDLCLKKEPSLTWKEWYLFWRKHQEDLLFTDFLNFNPQQAYYCIISREKTIPESYLFHGIDLTLSRAIQSKDQELIDKYIKILSDIKAAKDKTKIGFLDISKIVKTALNSDCYKLAQDIYQRYEGGILVPSYITKYMYNKMYSFKECCNFLGFREVVYEGEIFFNEDIYYRNLIKLRRKVRRITDRDEIKAYYENGNLWYEFIDYKRCSDETLLECMNYISSPEVLESFLRKITIAGRYRVITKINLKQEKYKDVLITMFNGLGHIRYRDIFLYFAVLLVKHHHVTLNFRRERVVISLEMLYLYKKLHLLYETDDYYSLLRWVSE